MSLFWKSFLWALASCFVSMGTTLSSSYTLSARVSAPEVSRMDECLLGGKNWECVDDHSRTTAIDPGAISWQEIPAHIYYNKYKLESKPLWDPYIGSGYPGFLDGIYRNASLIRQWLVFFPSDQGRDIAIFFRFLVWSWGIVFSVALLGASGGYLFFVGLAATMLPYLQKYLDIIFLDVEMVIPWAFALFLLPKNISFKKILIGFSILGFWVGTQSFIQAQIPLILVVCLIGLIYYFQLKNRVFFCLSVFLASFCLVGLYNALEFKSYFQEIVTTRKFMGCVADHGMSWVNIWSNSYIGLSKRAEVSTLFTILALPFVAYGFFKKKEVRYLVIVYLALIIWIIFGLPQLICNFVGLNAIYFWRHLIPYLQSLFLILSAASVYLAASNLKFRKTILCLGYVLAIVPASNRTMVSVEHLKGRFPKEHEFDFSTIPEVNVFSLVQRWSQQQDRRHFSPDYRLYPNYSAAFEILDMRVVNGGYPKRIFALNDELFTNWHELAYYKHADRFISVDNPQVNFPSLEFEKLMILHRVSMITSSNSYDWIAKAQLYNSTNCHLEKRDQLASLYFCPFVGGVGFFPSRVILVSSLEDGIKTLKEVPAKEVLDLAVIETQSQKAVAAVGKVIEVQRDKDKVTYQLNIEKSGFFVFADTYFPGWQATVNGHSTEIFPANIGFKSVWVPTGSVTLVWTFTKNRNL